MTTTTLGTPRAAHSDLTASPLTPGPPLGEPLGQPVGERLPLHAGGAAERLGHVGQDVALRRGVILAERDAGQGARGLAQRPVPLGDPLGIGQGSGSRARTTCAYAAAPTR